MPSLITCASALPGKTGKHEDCIFHFSQSLLHFFNLFDSRLILTLLYDSLNLVINAISSGLLGGMVQEKGSRECCSSRTASHAQSTSALYSGFPLSQGNAEALGRWGGKTRHRLISYLLTNTSAKNYCNRIVYVMIIASQRWDIFLRQCTCSIMDTESIIDSYVDAVIERL